MAESPRITYHPNGKCGRCKAGPVPISKYGRRSSLGRLFYRWYCKPCAIAEGFVTPVGYGG